MRNCSQVNATENFWLWVNVGSGIGLVSLANNLLPESMLTQIYVVIWRNKRMIQCIEYSYSLLCCNQILIHLLMQCIEYNYSLLCCNQILIHLLMHKSYFYSICVNAMWNVNICHMFVPKSNPEMWINVMLITRTHRCCIWQRTPRNMHKLRA